MNVIFQPALERIAAICDNARDEAGALRQIRQIVRIAFGKAGIEPMPVEEEKERLQYVIDLGAGLQVENVGGKLLAWVNDRELRIEAVQVALANGENPKVSLEYEVHAEGFDGQIRETE